MVPAALVMDICDGNPRLGYGVKDVVVHPQIGYRHKGHRAIGHLYVELLGRILIYYKRLARGGADYYLVVGHYGHEPCDGRVNILVGGYVVGKELHAGLEVLDWNLGSV